MPAERVGTPVAQAEHLGVGGADHRTFPSLHRRRPRIAGESARDRGERRVDAVGQQLARLAIEASPCGVIVGGLGRGRRPVAHEGALAAQLGGVQKPFARARAIETSGLRSAA